MYFQEKLYSQGVFSDGEHENGFQLVMTADDLDFGIKNKNLWVKDINDI